MSSPGKPRKPTDWNKFLGPDPLTARPPKEETKDEKEQRLARRHGFGTVEAYRAYKTYRDTPPDETQP